MSRSSSKTGFTIVELLSTLVLLGVAALISARLFGSSMRVIGNARATETLNMSQNSMTAAMRRDIWGAATLELPGSHAITLSYRDGSVIRWRLGDGNATRSTGGAKASDEEFQTSTSWQAERSGPAILLKPSSASENDRRRLRFVSQIMTAEQWK